MNDYISVKEFAATANVSVQGVYKRLRKNNDPLQAFAKIVDGITVIDKAGLMIYRAEPTPQVMNSAPAANRIAELESQLAAKDKQIESLIETVNSLSQALRAANEHR